MKGLGRNLCCVHIDIDLLYHRLALHETTPLSLEYQGLKSDYIKTRKSRTLQPLNLIQSFWISTNAVNMQYLIFKMRLFFNLYDIIDVKVSIN